jgi:hypothetical protein
LIFTGVPKSGTSGTYFLTSSSNDSLPCFFQQVDRERGELFGDRTGEKAGVRRDRHVVFEIRPPVGFLKDGAAVSDDRHRDAWRLCVVLGKQVVDLPTGDLVVLLSVDGRTAHHEQQDHEQTGTTASVRSDSHGTASEPEYTETISRR